jgi:dihydrofolate reductase
LLGSDGESGGDDYGFQDFFASVDTLVMGRHTYEFALTFNEWPYRGKRVVVLSHGYPETFTRLADGVEGLSSSPDDLVRALASHGSRRVYVDGANTIQAFLRAGLIHDITITRIPVLIGDGISLFGPTTRDIRLRHVRTTSFDNGFVQSTYRVTTAV